jgi:uncharacterized protein (TIGR01568 family)
MDKKPKLQKSIKLYLSKKLKKVPTLNLNHPINPSGASWLPSACKYPKTPSFDDQDPDTNHKNNHTATLTDVDRFLFENFRSLYLTDSSETLKRQTDSSASASSVTSSSESNDITEGENAGVAIVTFSMDPYEDMRRSMKGMVDAHHMASSRPLDWDFLEELLFCYLELNDRSVHKHVLRAFSDITARVKENNYRVKGISKRTVNNNNIRRWKQESEEELPESLGSSHDFPDD